MRRILRIVWNAATALSLLLCGVAVAFWIRSYAVTESGVTPDGSARAICSFAGGLWYQVDRQWPDLSDMRDGGGPIEPEYHWLLMGVVHSAGREGRMDANRDRLFSTYCERWRVPYGFVVSLALALPILRGVRRMLTRLTPGRCSACGYDLRATPDRCPECGTVAAGATDAPARNSAAPP